MAGRALCVLVGWMAMFTASTTPVASTAASDPPVTPGPDICALVPDASCRPIIPKLCYQGKDLDTARFIRNPLTNPLLGMALPPWHLPTCVVPPPARRPTELDVTVHPHL